MPGRGHAHGNQGDFADVVRGVSSGGTSADARSISELLDRAWAERAANANAPPTQAEVAQVQQLLDNPNLADKFSPELRQNLQSFVNGTATQRPVSDFVPNLSRFTQAPEVAGRFAADYTLMREQLIEQPGLTASDKANRAFEFFSRYAERFVTLANGASQMGEQGDASGDSDTGGGSLDSGANKALFELREGLLGEPLPADERAQAVAKFLEHLKSFGFLQLIDQKSGKDGVSVAKQLLQAKSPAEFERQASLVAFEAPGWELPKSYGQAAKAAFVVPDPGVPDLVPRKTPTATSRLPVKDLGVSGTLHDRRPDVSAVPGRPDLVRVNQGALDAAKIPPRAPELQPRDWRGNFNAALGRVRDKVLGPNLVWNFLHRFRRGADAEEEPYGADALDKMAMVAMMGLLGLVFVAIALYLLW